MDNEELRQKCNRLEVELKNLRALITLSETTTTKTGKIRNLRMGAYYFTIGQRGQVYSRKLSQGNVDQFRYLNCMRRLFLTEKECLKQIENDLSSMYHMDIIDREGG